MPDKRLVWDHILTLQPRYLILETPMDESKYLLMSSWEEEKEYIQGLSFNMLYESYDNDFSSRVLAVFERRAESSIASPSLKRMETQVSASACGLLSDD